MPLNCERKCQHICKYGDVTVICDNLKKKEHDLQIFIMYVRLQLKALTLTCIFLYTTPCSLL